MLNHDNIDLLRHNFNLTRLICFFFFDINTLEFRNFNNFIFFNNQNMLNICFIFLIVPKKLASQFFSSSFYYQTINHTKYTLIILVNVGVSYRHIIQKFKLDNSSHGSVLDLSYPDLSYFVLYQCSTRHESHDTDARTGSVSDPLI